eukprot:s4100_g4.t1
MLSRPWTGLLLSNLPEERSDVFPATWSGASRPLSLFEAPASASRQLALSWRSPVIHLKAEEVAKVEEKAPRPKAELQGRVPDVIHPLSGPRWIFVSEMAQVRKYR